MVVNSAGAQVIFDGGTPRLISATTAVGVTGGQLVYFSGAGGVVSSGTYSFNTGSVLVAGVASGAQFNGMVITPGNTSSGTNSIVTVATAGTFISTADGTVRGGEAVTVAGVDSIQVIGSLGGTALQLGAKHGRAITGAASGTGNYAVWTITP